MQPRLCVLRASKPASFSVSLLAEGFLLQHLLYTQIELGMLHAVMNIICMLQRNLLDGSVHCLNQVLLYTACGGKKRTLISLTA